MQMGERHPAFSGEAQEQFLLMRFLQVRTAHVKSHQLQKVPGLRHFGKDAARFAGECADTFEAYLSAYAARHSESQTKVRRAFLASETGYLERVYAAQHLVGRVVAGTAGRVVMAAGRKTEKFVASRSDTVRESPFLRKTIRILAAGAVTAVALAILAHYIPTLTVALIAKRLTVGALSYLGFKYILPLAFSHMGFFQNHPRTLVFVREVLGWAGYGLGFAYANHISAGTMHNLHMRSPDESLNTTARNIGVYIIDKIQGAPRFMPVDSSPTSPLANAVNNVSLAYEARSGSSALNEMWTNLSALESHSMLLLNTLDNRKLVSDGAKIMEHLRILETSRLHGGDHGYGTFSNISLSLQKCRSDAQACNQRFAAAAQTAAAERNKNSIEIGIELANALPLQPLPPLNDFFLTHHPAHLLAEVPVAHTDGGITPEAFFQSESVINARLHTINDVINYYTHIINPRFNPGDQGFASLLHAQRYFQYLSNQLHAMEPLFRSLPPGHVVTNHHGAPSGTDLIDLQILDSIRHTHFSNYERVWDTVRSANARAESIHPGHTVVNGKDVPVNQVVPFKEGAYYSDLTPFMNNALVEAESALNRVGVHLHVTEGWKIGYHEHISQCHRDGTCVDLAPESPKGFTGRDIYEIFKVLGPQAKRLLLASKTDYGTEILRSHLRDYLIHDLHYTPHDATLWMHQHADIETKINATADNLHFEPKDGQPIDPVVIQ